MDNVLRSECDHRLLHRLVRNELREDERQVVEQHLNHCDQCARQVCEDATIDWDWEAVQHSLGSDDFDIGDWMSGRRGECDEIESPTINQVTDRTDRPAVLMREISGWLDPTDDPNMMGRFAGYEIVGIVGHGGMGIVLKGFESSLNRYVAIKILAPRLATNGAARKRFSREAQAAAAVRHDNVIAVHRVDERHGLPFLVMPYVAGISLQNRMDDEGPLSVEAILRIGSQVAAGLAAAHAQGLVHRDIKPANILLENGVERVTITDFGLARAIDDATITRTGIIAGTPQFMSPEQAQAKPLDHRSDLFSLGSLMYAMATGRPPFRSDDNHEILQKISSDKTRGVREIQPYVPEWLSDIIDWLHEKSPSDRPQSAAEVAELLEAWLAHLQNPDTVPAPDRPISLSSTRKARPSSHWRQGLPVIAAGAIALLAGIIFIVETGKGTVRIESNIDGAPIIVSRDDKVVETLTVTQEGASIRLAAGFYRIQIGGGIDGVTIDRETIRLRRGEEIVAHVHATDPEAILVGEIVDISRNGTVELSIGSDDGVFVGMEFIVLNDNDDKTLLQVTDVIAHAALAKPTGGHRENAVKNGDRVQQVVENKSLNVKERGVLSAGLNIAVNQILDRLRSAHELKGRSSGQWGDELVRFAMCEGHRSTEIALLYGDELAAFGFTTPVYDLNNRTLVAEIAFRKRLPDGTWELIHVDMEPPDGAARDLANFRRNRPDARELTTEPDDLRPDVVLKHARSDDFEDAGMTTNELIGKWRVASVTGSGRGAVGDEPIGEFVEFGAHTMTTFRDENRSQKSVLGYTLDEHGKLQLQVIRSEKLAEIILGRAEYGHNSLNLALNISAPNSQFPVSANPDEVESNVKYFHLIREPQTKDERLDCEERDKMYLRMKEEEQPSSPSSRAIPTNRNVQDVREQEKPRNEALRSEALLGKWRVSSVAGRTAVGDHLIGEVVEFETNAMNSTIYFPESLTEHQVFARYALTPNGEIRIEFLNPADVRLGKIEIDGDSLFLALRADNIKYPISAKSLGREPETDVLYLQYQRAELKEPDDRIQSSIEQPQSEQPKTTVESINGTVVNVDKNGLVLLSVGSDDGVSEGMWFAVLRGGVVAHAKVKKVSHDHAVASIEWRFNNSFVAQNDQIFELRSSDQPRRGTASDDCFDSVKVTRTEATINGVFRHPGKLILQIGDALPETELRSELKLPVGSFVAEIMYVVEHKDTDYERPRIAMRVAKSGTDFASAKYSTVTIPLQVENLAQDRRLRFREGGHHIATLDGSSSSQALNKIVFADVILKSGGKIPVSLVAEQIVREEQADHSGLYRQIKQLSSRFRMVDDPKAIKSDPWGELVEEIRTHRGHKSVRFGVLYADDSSAVGISIPIGHDDGELLGVRITAGVKDGKWQITDIDVQPMDDSKNELRKFVEEHPNAIPHGTQLQDEITDLGSSEQPTYRSMSPKASSDLSRLQGEWAMIEYTGADGKQDLKIDHQKHEAPFRIAINGNKFTGPYFPLPMLGGPRESVIELAPDKSPKEMRLTTDLDDGTKEIAHLLYRFQGDKLELSFVDDEAYRLLPADFPNEKPTGRIATATFGRVDSADGDSMWDSAINSAAKQFIRFWVEVPQETRYVELQHTFFKQMKEEITDAEVLSSSQGENADGEPIRILLFRVEDQYFCMHTERDELRALYRILRVPGYGAGHKIAKRFPKMSPLYLQATGLQTILSDRTDVDAPSFPYRLVHQWGDSTDEVNASDRLPEELSIELLQKRVDLLAAAIATQGGSHEDLVRAGMDLKRAQIANSKSDNEKRKLLDELVTMYDQLIQFQTLEVDKPPSVSASGQPGRSNQASLASDLLLLKSERLGVSSERAAIPSSLTGLKPGVKFSVHLVGSEATATTTTLKDCDSDEQLHLINPPIISSTNIQSAEVKFADDGQVSLDVTVDQAGGQRMLGATSKPKMRLAIVVKGKIVSSPIAHAPISNHFSVTGKQSREYWEQFITTPPAPEKPKLEDAK